MQHILLTGRLCADPTLGSSQNAEYARFRLATSTSRKDEEGNYKANFYTCTGWTSFVRDRIAKLSKGQLVCVSGTPEINTYRDRTGQERMDVSVSVSKIESLSPPPAPRTEPDLMEGLD